MAARPRLYKALIKLRLDGQRQVPIIKDIRKSHQVGTVRERNKWSLVARQNDIGRRFTDIRHKIGFRVSGLTQRQVIIPQGRHPSIANKIKNRLMTKVGDIRRDEFDIWTFNLCHIDTPKRTPAPCRSHILQMQKYIFFSTCKKLSPWARRCYISAKLEQVRLCSRLPQRY